MTTPNSSADVEGSTSEASESETLAESPATQPRADSEAEPELDAPSEVSASETPAESATTQPAVEAEPDTAVVAAPTAGSAGAEPAVEAAVADAMPEEPPTTRQRAARAPAWAWVAITLMALLVMTGLITLAVARNANPSTPEAVEDAQTLITELEALNGYLATTNQLMSNAIASAEQLSAAAQAKLAGLSAKLGDAEPRVGQARALLGDQLSGPTRSQLDGVQQQLQSQRLTLAQRTERLEEQLLATISGAVAGLDDRVGGATGSRASASEARIAALEGKQADTEQGRAQLQAEADRLRAEAELVRAAVRAQQEAIQAQRERALDAAAQIRQLRRTVAALQRIVDRLSSRRP